jgi:hypothetical protein
MFILQFFLFLLIQIVFSWHSPRKFSTSSTSTNRKNYGLIRGSTWDTPMENYGCKVLGPLSSLEHMGDSNPLPLQDSEEQKRKAQYHLNVGRALEGLRKELPLVFIANELDFSIFAPSITIIDGGQRRIQISKGLYSGVVKSLRMAATFSSIYPSMNVRKIEYLDDCSSIQCLVDVVLPDAVRVDGQVSNDISLT